MSPLLLLGLGAAAAYLSSSTASASTTSPTTPGAPYGGPQNPIAPPNPAAYGGAPTQTSNAGELSPYSYNGVPLSYTGNQTSAGWPVVTDGTNQYVAQPTWDGSSYTIQPYIPSVDGTVSGSFLNPQPMRDPLSGRVYGWR